MKEERFDALVASIYEAGSGRVPWRDPLDALAGAFDSPRSILTGILTPALRPAFRDEGGRCDPGLTCEALHGNHADDPALARLLVAPPGRWLFEEDVPPSDGTP